MMDYLDSLNSAHQASPHPAVAEMKRFAEQVSSYLGEPARCELLLGGLVNYGQEYRAVLTFPPLNFAQTLWRAYVPLDQGKLHIHPSGGAMEEVADLHARLLDFLSLPAVKETLQYIKGKSELFRTTGRVWAATP